MPGSQRAIDSCGRFGARSQRVSFLVAWPSLWRVALLRALTPAPDENLNPAEWRKIEAVRFWIRVDEGACDRGALEGEGSP